MVGVAEDVETLGGFFGDRAAAPFGDLLRQPGDSRALPADHVPLIGGEIAVEELHERAFPLAVAAEKADSLSLLHLKIDLIEQQRAAEGKTHAPKAQQRHDEPFSRIPWKTSADSFIKRRSRRRRRLLKDNKSRRGLSTRTGRHLEPTGKNCTASTET